MAERHPVHQPPQQQGRLVSNLDVYRPALLPYERQILELIGLSEEQYRQFCQEAWQRSKVRPAEYDRIPDIQNPQILVPIIVSLAVGAITTAISYALTPKPSAPKYQETTQRTLDSINGSQRFTATFGFNSQAELATFGEPIPIVFGRWTGATGGILMSPKLVWSRMFSYGREQGVKLLFVVGEQGTYVDDTTGGFGIQPYPALSGIFLGNGVLDAIYEQTFAFYWKGNTNIAGRIRASFGNLKYGTRGTLASGDPDNNEDVYSCPVGDELSSPAFCAAHSLSNNTEFGCYSPISNGNIYRVNWRIISIIKNDGDQGRNLTFERVKISGNNNDPQWTNDSSSEYTLTTIKALGMDGVGRAYSRRMGITALNDQTVSDSDGFAVRFVNKGDIATFTIDGGKIKEDFYKGTDREVSVDDINNVTEEMRNAADDSLQVGEVFMIGRTTWQVISRSLPIWRLEDGKTQTIKLKCIDINPPATNTIGIVSKFLISADYVNDNSIAPGGGKANRYNIGAAFFPLMKVAKATVRNTRACDATEIGIKSNVFQRLNNLCNFQTIPTPDLLKTLDDNRVQVSAGSINTYIARSSVFTIFLRPAGVDASGNEYTWQPLGEQFCIIGNEPKDQYNFVRLSHPDKRQYEFQLIPKNGADLGQSTPDDAEFWHLNHGIDNTATRQELVGNYSTPYGVFKVNSVGRRVRKLEVKSNAEFMTQPGSTQITLSTPRPSSVGILVYLPDEPSALDRTLSSVEWLDWYTNAAYDYSTIGGRMGSFTWELAQRVGIGAADNHPAGENAIVNVEYQHNITGDRWYKMRYALRKAAFPAPWSNQNYSWHIESETVVAASNNWEGLGEFIATFDTASNNPWRQPTGGAPAIATIGRRYRVTGIIQRDTSTGRRQGYYHEIFGNADSYARGTTRTYDITWTSNMVIRLSSTTTDSGGSFGRTNLWSEPIVQINSVYNTFALDRGATFTDQRTVSSGNPFRTPGTTVGIRLILEAMTAASSKTYTYAGRVFEFQSQYADISLYGNLVEKSNANNPEHTVVYINEIVKNDQAPQYTNMTIAGLALKASRNFSNLDQVRFWLKNGMPVRRLHPDEAGTVGASNLFTDLVYYLLTDRIAGVGNTLNMRQDYAPLVNTEVMAQTARYLRSNGLFFDGVIGNTVNVRQFIADIAPFMLCNFAITDGKFSLVPALPATSEGAISTRPINIKQLFTAGNILQDSFELSYLSAEERKDFQANMRFRQERENQLSSEKNIVVRWNDGTDSSSHPLEQFDMLQYCTSQAHAELVARFFMSIRRRITHSVQFKTTPYGMDLAPGDYIRVVTEANPYSSAQNGSISASGIITSATSFTDGQYRILFYKADADDVTETTMTISGGVVQETTLRGSVFTLLTSTVSQNVYMIEQLTLDIDGTVQISASEFPCDDRYVSLIAKDVTNPGLFTVES